MKIFNVLFKTFITVTFLLSRISFVASEKSIDICILPQEVGECRAIVPAWWFNSTSHQCEKFTYGGCGGNANNFQTKDECTEHCNPSKICKLSSDAGPCYATKPAWYYDSAHGECKQFIYGGCMGNTNRFETEADCLKFCNPYTICKLPADQGPCRGEFSRWYYDCETEKCENFVYGGCRGNANNFPTEEKCLKTCCMGV